MSIMYLNVLLFKLTYISVKAITIIFSFSFLYIYFLTTLILNVVVVICDVKTIYYKINENLIKFLKCNLYYTIYMT